MLGPANCLLRPVFPKQILLGRFCGSLCARSTPPPSLFCLAVVFNYRVQGPTWYVWEASFQVLWSRPNCAGQKKKKELDKIPLTGGRNSPTYWKYLAQNCASDCVGTAKASVCVCACRTQDVSARFPVIVVGGSLLHPSSWSSCVTSGSSGFSQQDGRSAAALSWRRGRPAEANAQVWTASCRQGHVKRTAIGKHGCFIVIRVPFARRFQIHSGIHSWRHGRALGLLFYVCAHILNCAIVPLAS